jgi:hypothetical protein
MKTSTKSKGYTNRKIEIQNFAFYFPYAFILLVSYKHMNVTHNSARYLYNIQNMF